jgi:hypothetical protein
MSTLQRSNQRLRAAQSTRSGRHFASGQWALSKPKGRREPSKLLPNDGQLFPNLVTEGLLTTHPDDVGVPRLTAAICQSAFEWFRQLNHTIHLGVPTLRSVLISVEIAAERWNEVDLNSEKSRVPSCAA